MAIKEGTNAKEENKTENSIKLTPKNDIIFQSIFSKGHEKITKAMISSIIKTEITEIYMDASTHLSRKYMDSKLGILDLRVKLQDGIQCNVEVQLTDKGDTEERFLWYLSNQYVAQLKKNERYKKLKKTIGILILDYELTNLSDIEEYCTNWKWREEKYHNKILTEKMEIYIIELPKIIRRKEELINDSLVQWILFLDNPESKEVQKIMTENKDIKEAVEAYEDVTSNQELRRVAELREKAIRDENNFLATIKEMQEDIKKGKEDIKKGKEEIKKDQEDIRKSKEDIKKGKEEIQKNKEKYQKQGKEEEKIQIAKNLLKMGMTIEQIEEATGLTKEKIEKLKNNV